LNVLRVERFVGKRKRVEEVGWWQFFSTQKHSFRGLAGAVFGEFCCGGGSRESGAAVNSG
jgi:hypothetical protein